MPAAEVLVADDSAAIRSVLERLVAEMGHHATCVRSAKETLSEVEDNQYDVVLLDLRFPDCEDLSTLAEIRRRSPSTDVIMVTAETDNLEMVSEAVRLGAFDYVPKPIRPDDIRIRLTRAIETRSLKTSRRLAIGELSKGNQIEDIVGDSAAMRAVVEDVKKLAEYDVPVLITGETGTGKELIARALHYSGPRRDQPFIAINCAALPSELVESELFGYEKGAFTGAYAARKGAFEEASEGTILLDEIGDMSLQAQAALLRVLENKVFRSVGGKTKSTNARVVLATNQDLGTLISERRFREDLFYRIDRMRVEVPPLRERAEDIPALACHFLELMNEKVGRNLVRIADAAIECLQQHHWPGNVRELKNEIERAYVYADGDGLALAVFSPHLVSQGTKGEVAFSDPKSLEEKERMLQALKVTRGNIKEAARLLGLHRNTVHRWIKKYGLQDAVGQR